MKVTHGCQYILKIIISNHTYIHITLKKLCKDEGWFLC